MASIRRDKAVRRARRPNSPFGHAQRDHVGQEEPVVVDRLLRLRMSFLKVWLLQQRATSIHSIPAGRNRTDSLHFVRRQNAMTKTGKKEKGTSFPVLRYI